MVAIGHAHFVPVPPGTDCRSPAAYIHDRCTNEDAYIAGPSMCHACGLLTRVSSSRLQPAGSRPYMQPSHPRVHTCSLHTHVSSVAPSTLIDFHALFWCARIERLASWLGGIMLFVGCGVRMCVRGRITCGRGILMHKSNELSASWLAGIMLPVAAMCEGE